ncbi:MAG: enoyl-CoA hydratase/isomerase family protein [Sphingobacteriaceae bacterium]|nr:enoyl-CoA hydratase/isomerase family protein [Sphingobacteriaceae bacterium]
MSFIQSNVNGHVLFIRLNRPDKFNSFNRAMSLQLIGELEKAKKDPNVRCVLISGEGKAFCAGQDLAEALDPNGPGIQKIVEEHYNPIILRIRNIEKPVIALVNGVAAGAGANIALACDIVLASKSASFIQAFSKIGLIPDSGGTFTLPRLIGMQLASALMITGDKLSAEAAKGFGMVYQIFEDAEAQDAALRFAENIAAMPTKAIGFTKRLLNQSYSNNLEQQLNAEGEIQVQAANTYDYNEGVKAFLEKRKPLFKGE